MVFILGITGVTYFKGAYYYCFQGQTGLAGNFEIDTRFDCLNAGGEWWNRVSQFNDVPAAMATIFHMSTTAGWAEVMYWGIYSRGIDLEPQYNANPFMGLYFVFVMCCCCFFAANMFVGVVISAFNKERDELGKEYLLTSIQKQWIKTQMLVFRSTPLVVHKPPKSVIRKPFFFLANNRWFKKIIKVLILLNTALLCVKWYGME